MKNICFQVTCKLKVCLLYVVSPDINLNIAARAVTNLLMSVSAYLRGGLYFSYLCPHVRRVRNEL